MASSQITVDFSKNVYSHKSLTGGLNGKVYTPFIKSVEASWSSEPNLIMGGQRIPVGKTPGELKTDLSIEWANAYFAQEFIDNLGAGYMDAVFPITFSYSEKGQKTTTYLFSQVQLKKDGIGSSDKDASCKMEFTVFTIPQRNGVDVIE